MVDGRNSEGKAWLSLFDGVCAVVWVVLVVVSGLYFWVGVLGVCLWCVVNQVFYSISGRRV